MPVYNTKVNTLHKKNVWGYLGVGGFQIRNYSN